MRDIQTNNSGAGISRSAASGIAGNAPPHTPHHKSGRWTVRRAETCLIGIFHRFSNRQETILDEFAPVQDGEIEVKSCAVHIRNIHPINLIQNKEPKPCPSSSIN